MEIEYSKVFYKKARSGHCYIYFDLRLFIKGRGLGSTQIFSAIHYFSTFIIYEGYHEKGSICTVYCSLSHIGCSSDLCRSLRGNLIGLLRCIKHHVWVWWVWTATFSASYSSSHGYLFLLISYYTCTSTASIIVMFVPLFVGN